MFLKLYKKYNFIIDFTYLYIVNLYNEYLFDC